MAYVECHPYWRDYVFSMLQSYSDPLQLKILVPACGESCMSAEIFDAGYVNITNIDISFDVIRRMLRFHHSDRPNMLWRVGDITDLKFAETVDVIIDKGAIDSLSSSHHLYLDKMKGLLNMGGKFVCFLNYHPATIDLVLQRFRMGFKTTFVNLSENHDATLVIAEKVEHILPYLLSDYVHVQDVNANLHGLIVEENKRRLDMLQDMELTLFEIESGVMGDPNSIVVGRYFCVKWTGRKVHGYPLEYELLVLDVNPPVNKYSWHVFFVTQMTSRLIGDSEEERLSISSHAQAARVYVVYLEGSEVHPIKELERDLEEVFRRLAPEHILKPSIKSEMITQIELLTFKEKEEEKNIEFPPKCSLTETSSSNAEPNESILVEGYLFTNCPSSANSEKFRLQRPCVEQCPNFSIDLPALGYQFHVDRNNIEAKLFLVAQKYELTLSTWLTETENRWCSTYESWNAASFKERTNVSTVENWNSSRPVEECCLVISGLIRAVCDYHLTGKVHGNLSNTDSYLMMYRKQTIGGWTQNVVDVYLCHPTSQVKTSRSISSDMMELSHVIFKVILENKRLPRLWQDLEQMLLLYARCNSPRDFGFDKIRVMQNHPSCWPWYRRFEYFECLWMHVNRDNFSAMKFDVRKAIRDVKVKERGNLEWMDSVPVDTPLHRVLLKFRFCNDPYDLFRYIRIVGMHLYDYDKETGELQYFIGKESEIEYKKNQFVEVVITECFPNFGLGIYKSLQKILDGKSRQVSR